MPIYEYRCANDHVFDVFQNMSDDPVEACEECGAPVERVFHPVAVHFKGSGFYSTDYAGKGKAGAEGSKDGASGESSAESKGDGKSESKGKDSKAESKSGSKGSGE
jgi:putative FmdB family regulatory protein